MELRVLIDGVEHATVPMIDGNDAFNREAERGALDRAYEAASTNPEAKVTIVVDLGEDKEDVEAATLNWFDRIRAGDPEAIDEAILMIRTHALPEEHPLALD